MKNTVSFFLLVLLFISCGNTNTKPDQKASKESTYTNPLLKSGGEPWAIFHNGFYYYTQGSEDKIILWKTSDLTDLKYAPEKIVWIPKDPSYSYHLWGPELHRINNKWYIYFAADDGNMDNHQIYVIESDSEDPMEGEFVMKGRISTDANNNWAIHPNVFEHKGEWYMIWSGWQMRRIETENQCIYIARMETPWKLSSDRALLSKPEFEWERQWINPDGSRTAYPIYVNEEPQYFHSKNKNKVIIYYSASGNWTPYYTVGMLTADADSDLLNPASWEKSKTPVFRQNPDSGVYGTGALSFIPSPDGSEFYFLYHARDVRNEAPGSADSRSPRLQKLEWDEDGLPMLGVPLATTEKLDKPSGTK